MDILRGKAHLLLVAPLVADGLGAALKPEPHVKQVLRQADRVGLSELHPDRVRLATRLSGAATALLGVYLVVGKHKRPAAFLLAGTTSAMMAVNCHSHLDAAQKRKLLGYGSAVGGLLLATMDRKGVPSRRWEREFRRELTAPSQS